MSSRDLHSYFLTGLLQISETARSTSAAAGLNTLLDALEHNESKYEVLLLVAEHALPTHRALLPTSGDGMGQTILRCAGLIRSQTLVWY